VACGFTPRSVRGVAAGAEPEVRIHLPPAESLLRTWLSAYEEVPRARRGKEARMVTGHVYPVDSGVTIS
jgi:hypothetical protein